MEGGAGGVGKQGGRDARRSHTKGLEGPKTPSRQVIKTTEVLKCLVKNNTFKVLYIWPFYIIVHFKLPHGFVGKAAR